MIQYAILKGRCKIMHRDVRNSKKDIIMEQNGFTLDSEFQCFIKEGFGMFLTNVDAPLKQLIKKDFYLDLMAEGCQLVEGPAAPADNGKFYSEMAIYIANYKEILAKRRQTQHTTDITDDIIDAIAKTFQQSIDNYDLACLHGNLGINIEDILDTAISEIYEYEKEITKKYQGKDLYTILCNLKTSLTGNERCKNHIIYTLENSLFSQVFKDSCIETSKVSDLVSKGLKLIHDYGILQEHTNLGLNLTRENDITIKNIHDFIDIVNTCSLEERCAVLHGINKFYADSKSSLPESAAIIINSIRDSVFEEKFGKNADSLGQK